MTPDAQSGECELTILMPCLNEAATVGACVRRAVEFLRAHEVSGEVLVADNESADGSAQIAAAAGARVVPVADRGYGNALMGGIAAARGQFIIMGDADGSYDFSALGPFLRELRAGAELVMGNRFAGGIQRGAMPALNRFLGNPVLTAFGRLFFHSPVRDFHCGLRGFERVALARLELQTTGMEWASEMVVKATLLGLRIREVPTTLAPAGRPGPSHLRPWRDGWRHLRFMLLYCPRWLFLYPGILMVLVGVLVGAWLMPGPRRVGNVTFDIHTLLYAALAVLLGFQTIWFAVFTKVFAITEGLMPPDARLTRGLRWFTLEVGLVAGGTLLLLGLVGSIAAVRAWGATSFGPLEPSRTLRTIIPAVLALTLGGQLVLASLFLSVLRLRRRGARTS